MEVHLSMFLNDVRPLCKCGCKGETRFRNIHTGFNDFMRGHQARISNNWGHNPKALEKSQDKRREQIADGTWTPWNKGETKETHEAVVAYGRGTAESFTDEKRDRYSKIMMENRSNGTIPTLFGKDSSQWKGGVSSVQALSRSYVYNVWTYPKLLEGKFTCKRCGIKSSDDGCVLNVHHDGERFAAILQKARDVLGDVTEDFACHQTYAKWIADYHVQNSVSGIVLCEVCHYEEHATLKI